MKALASVRQEEDDGVADEGAPLVAKGRLVDQVLVQPVIDYDLISLADGIRLAGQSRACSGGPLDEAFVGRHRRHFALVRDEPHPVFHAGAQVPECSPNQGHKEALDVGLEEFGSRIRAW